MVFKNLAQKLLQNWIAVGVILLATNNGYSQLKMDGPQVVKPGTLVKIAVTGIETLNDVKIACYPDSGEWMAMRDFTNNNPIIIFLPSAESAGGQTFAFVVAGNKDNKTVMTAHSVQVTLPPGPIPVPGPPTPPIPVPPSPVPIPVPAGKYTDVLRSVYLVSPDNDSLIKLIGIYTAMANVASNQPDYKTMNAVLAKSTQVALGETDTRKFLIPLRNAVANILQTDLANRNSVTYDPVATKNMFLELAKSLQPLVNPTK